VWRMGRIVRAPRLGRAYRHQFVRAATRSFSSVGQEHHIALRGARWRWCYTAGVVILEPKTGLTVTSRTSTGVHARWFRTFLAEHGAALTPGCAFDGSLVTLDRFVGFMEAGRHPPMSVDESFCLAADAIGADFMTKAIHRTVAQTSSSFADFWPLFSTGDAVQVRPGKSSVARNRLWELLVAALLAEYSSDVVPGEPDIHCTYLDRRWGVACKAFYTTDRDHQVKVIVDGAKQLERAPVDRGIVAVNLANVFPHMELFNYDFSTSSAAIDVVKRLQAEYMHRFDTLRGASRLAVGKDSPRDKTRAVVFFCPTIINVASRPALYCNVETLAFRHIQHEEERFAASFLRAAATALSHPPPEGSAPFAGSRS
jgi:hypothetical protein